MSTLSYSVISPATGTAQVKPAGFFGAFVKTMGAEWRARRAARSVASLSDSMLHDIGVTRGEIDRVVRHGRASRAA